MAKQVKLSLPDFFEKGDQYYLPSLSIDCVIFGFHENELKVLLLQWKDTKRWSLPGGFILKKEHIDDAAVRILKDRTGLDNIYLQQFHAFGDPNRDKGTHGVKSMRNNKSWFNNRFITLGYFALVEFSRVTPTPDDLTVDCKWWDIKKIPALILDHNQILQKALEALRLHIHDYPVGKDLLPEKFTMPELQSLYETIFGTALDRRNFQKKVLSFGILERLKERKHGGAHKAPFLYRFDQRKYQQALKQGLKFGI